MFFREVPADFGAKGVMATGGFSGVGSARWFRALSSRSGLAVDEDVRKFTLKGERIAGMVRVVVLQDRSGSMETFAATRGETLEQLFEWLPAQLDATDEVGIIDFSDTAGEALPITFVRELTDATVRQGCPPGGTLITPAASLAAQLIEPGKKTWLVAISDGEVFDRLDPVLKRAFRTVSFGGVLLLNPATTRVPPAWLQSFPDTIGVEMTDLGPGGVAVAVGRAVAEITQQKLVRGRGRKHDA